MKPERWQRVEQLVHSALKLGEKQRADFLRHACGGDEALRHEVDRLLAHEQTAKSFLEAPALEMAAKAMAEEPDRALVGRQIGAYRITSLLGAGGMGEVYRAEDTRLARAVAMKVLPKELAQPHHLRIGSFPPLVGASQDTDPTFISHSDVVRDYGGRVVSVCHLVQRQVEIIRVTQGTDTLRHRGNVWAADRQTAAAEALHEPHRRQIKSQITMQCGEKTTVQGIVLA